MTLKEEKRNIFDLPEEYYLAHCISADYALGAGIATEFQKRFHLKVRLNITGNHTYPDCIMIGKVFNLVTKSKCYNKPTYDSFQKSIEMMKSIMVENNIKKLGIYKLGCTRDKLQWGKVKEIIQTVFADVDCEILVCSL